MPYLIVIHATVATIASDSMINTSTPPTAPPTIPATELSTVSVGNVPVDIALVLVGNVPVDDIDTIQHAIDDMILADGLSVVDDNVIVSIRNKSHYNNAINTYVPITGVTKG